MFSAHMSYLRLTDQRTNEVLEFERPEIRLGRAPDCEFVVSGEGSQVASGYHIRFVHGDDVWRVEDLGSRNGTFLDNVRQPANTPQKLRVGQVVRMGEKGPSFKVEALQKKAWVETIPETPAQHVARPSEATLPLSAFEPPDRSKPLPPTEDEVVPVKASEVAPKGTDDKTEPLDASQMPAGTDDDTEPLDASQMPSGPDVKTAPMDASPAPGTPPQPKAPLGSTPDAKTAPLDAKDMPSVPSARPPRPEPAPPPKAEPVAPPKPEPAPPPKPAPPPPKAKPLPTPPAPSPPKAQPASSPPAASKPAAPKQAAPSPPRDLKQGEMRVVLVEPKVGGRWEATGGRLRIGRGKECELRPIGPSDTSVSRVHSELLAKPGGRIVVRDAQSRNGTLLNGQKVIGEQVLKGGDRIQLGDHGPELIVDVLETPETQERKRKVAAQRAPAKAESALERADRVAEKLGVPRRSFGGKGATVFFKEMFHETEKKSAKRVRIAIWSSVGVIVVAAAGMYWYSEQRVRQAEIRQHAAIAAMADSIRLAADQDYQRLRQEVDAASRGSVPAAVLDSLRVALQAAQDRTTSLEAALNRAQSSINEQLAAGDSIRRSEQAELQRLRTQMSSASASGTPIGLLDSLQRMISAQEQRTLQITTQLRAARGVDLPAVAQANQGAIGLIAAYTPTGIFDGTGFVITPSGYFVTNRHVVERQGVRADSVKVTMADQRTPQRAEIVVIAQAGAPDIAVIKIRNYSGAHIPVVDWSGQNVRQGESAALIGYPAGLGNALDQQGYVRTLMSAGVFSRVTAETINFDGFTTGGSSGSPIFNASGEVVAIHRAGLSGATGLGFAIPIPHLIPLLPRDAREELGIQ